MGKLFGGWTSFCAPNPQEVQQTWHPSHASLLLPPPPTGHKRWVLFPPGTPNALIKPKGVEREAAAWFTHVWPRTQVGQTALQCLCWHAQNAWASHSWHCRPCFCGCCGTGFLPLSAHGWHVTC